jgi:hypothetical protein
MADERYSVLFLMEACYNRNARLYVVIKQPIKAVFVLSLEINFRIKTKVGKNLRNL